MVQNIHPHPNPLPEAREGETAPEAPKAPERLPFGFAKQHKVIVERVDNEKAIVKHCPGISRKVISEIRRFVGAPITLEPIAEEQFATLLGEHYENDSGETMQMIEELHEEIDLQRIAMDLPATDDLLEKEDDAPIIRLINAVLTEAIKQGASDIHIETYEERLVVRFRVDGVLRIVLEPRRILASLVVSRIKVMANLDIAEKRLPQDGRISVKIGGRPIDVRVSTMPSSHGERVVLRLLDKQAGKIDLTKLGLVPDILKLVEEIIEQPHGIILVTGPTGSGKTTTLYAILSKLNTEKRNILTVEDPIEYHLEGIGQTQVNPKVEMTFARGLRAILRQDPDVVMVGEIRDRETAEIAVQASLTGHLVLSTLHTNTAVGAVTRLKDMGIEPFLLATSLLSVIAQRLVRVLCHTCKQPYTASKFECETFGVDSLHPPTIHRAAGCPACNNIGYQGRCGIYDLVMIDEELRTMIHEGASEQKMEKKAREKTPSIRQDGWAKILSGTTTVEEVLRVTRED